MEGVVSRKAETAAAPNDFLCFPPSFVPEKHKPSLALL